MSANHRIYYAIHQVGLAENGTAAFTPVHGLQSVGINTKYNLVQIFELGQLAIYDNVEDVPDIEVTMEKVLDGYPLLMHLATYKAPSADLAGRSNQRTSLALSIFSDLQQACSGTPLAQVVCSGMYWSQTSFNFPTDGNFSESTTLVGNNKVWLASGFTFTGDFNDNDAPAAEQGVNRRQHLNMGACIFPLDIEGISGSGTNDFVNGLFGVHFQSIKHSVNLGREQILELGQKAPYFRYVQFPVEVRSDYEVIAINGDFTSANENAESDVNIQSIFTETLEGTKINCGVKNKMESVNYGGANAGSRGGNATFTYSYITFNDFTVVHPADPTVALQG